MLCFKPGKETHFQAKAYLYASHLEPLFSLYLLYTGCFYLGFYHFRHLHLSRGPKQTDKLTNTHTAHFSDNNLRPNLGKPFQIAHQAKSN